MLGTADGMKMPARPSPGKVGRVPVPAPRRRAATTLLLLLAAAAAGTTGLPDLGELIDERDGSVTGDISFLLDFAIVGFPKSGTTFMKDHLNRTSETFVYEREFCMKRDGDVARFVREYHALHVTLNQTDVGRKTVRFGIKCPGPLYRVRDLVYLREYFPSTRLIVGLRHPVPWMGSFYNYQSYKNVTLPPLTGLTGRCPRGGKVCTDRARFHAALARLGKTPMTDGGEVALLFGTRYEGADDERRRAGEDESARRRQLSETGRLPNRVLLYEIGQVHDRDASVRLSRSLERYLGLTPGVLPGIEPFVQVKPRAVNICDDEYREVRGLLVNHAIDAAEWIRDWFVRSPQVEVAAGESFFRFLEGWDGDPCESKYG